MKKALQNIGNRRTELLLYFLLIALVALGNGLSDSIYSNYFKEVYQVDSVQRGFIEFPRELPGVLCALLVAALSFLGDVRLSLLAQILTCLGLAVLGLFTPAFGTMLVFLFINSLGMHLFMPVQDSLGMSLAEPDQLGRRMGQFASVRSAVGFAAALLVFFGFRQGWFSFATERKGVFLLGALFFAAAVAVNIWLLAKAKPGPSGGGGKRFHLVFRREYKYYYLLTVLHGVQKQIAYVYGSWVIIDLLLKGADVMALLSIVSSFICIFFLHYLGKWMDRFGIKRMMFADALSFIFVYVLYGFVVWGIADGALPSVGWPVFCVFALFILDRLSMQLNMVKAVYLKSIALSEEDVVTTLSTGTSMDHVVAIVAAAIGGIIWAQWGSQWVFFMAALISVGNLIVAFRVKPEEERARALAWRKAGGKDLSA